VTAPAQRLSVGYVVPRATGSDRHHVVSVGLASADHVAARHALPRVTQVHGTLPRAMPLVAIATLVSVRASVFPCPQRPRSMRGDTSRHHSGPFGIAAMYSSGVISTT